MEKGGLPFCEQESVLINMCLEAKPREFFFAHSNTELGVNKFFWPITNKFLSAFFNLGVNSSFHFVKSYVC